MPVVSNYYDNLDAVNCFVCDKKFCLNYGKQELLSHLYLNHKVVIENESIIADLREYMDHYREIFHRANSLDGICKPFILAMSERKLHVLGDHIPGDEMLRKEIHRKKYDVVKAQHADDMSDKMYKKHCFYCHEIFRTTRVAFIDHLFSHGFQLGRPSKLVFIEKFVNVIQEVFVSYRCLFCFAKYTSISELVVHMNEKAHNRINPENQYFDQFYIINYKSYGKSWKDFCKKKLEKTRQKGRNSQQKCNNNCNVDESGSGHNTDRILCLFCRHRCRSWDGALLHMIVSHKFNFKEKIQSFQFYDQVKMVNFIRQRVSNLQCICCDARFTTKNGLLSHVEANGHLEISEKKLWEQPEYLFSTMGNDAVLFHLKDVNSNELGENIISDDSPRSIINSVSSSSPSSITSDETGSSSITLQSSSDTGVELNKKYDSTIKFNDDDLNFTNMTKLHAYKCTGSENCMHVTKVKFTNSRV